MKKIFLLGMVAGLLASCQSKTDGYTIEGTLTFGILVGSGCGR